MATRDAAPSADGSTDGPAGPAPLPYSDARPPDGAASPVGPWGGQFIDPSLPSTTPATFTGSATSDPALRMVYPLDGSLHPTNLLDMTLQWQRGSAGSVFRIRFENDRGTFDLFAPCAAAECVYAVPEQVWRQIAGMNRDRDVKVTITGARAGGDLASTPITLRFSPAAVQGGLYYWSTKLQGTYRLALGQKKATPFLQPPAGGCYGCHTVSRRGNRIAWTDMPRPPIAVPIRPRNLLLAATEMPAMRVGGPSMPSSALTLNPDGSRVLVSDGAGGLTLRDAATGAELGKTDATLFAGGRGAFLPEWSPDGKTIAVTLGPTSGVFSLRFALAEAEIALLPYNDDKFGSPTVLVPRGDEIHFYPTWSPDGKWLAFCSAPARPSPGTGDSYDNPSARLRLIATTGGPIYELGRATQGAGTTASWPKFTPFSQLDGQLLFLGFSSKIDYGFLKRDKTRPQLWLAAIDLRRLADKDPSWAPIWLPFQEVDQNNHLPYWTESVGCVTDADCGQGATCKPQGCVPTVIE